MKAKILKRFFACAMAVVAALCSVSLGGVDLLKINALATSYKVGDIIEFGSYPQSKVTDKSTLSALNKKNLSWKSYDYYSGDGSSGSMVSGDWMQYADVTCGNEKYRAVKFTKYRPYFTKNSAVASNLTSVNGTYQDDNGYYTNNIYWFKFEPLKWRILNPVSGFIISESIIDSQAYSNTMYKNATDAYGYAAYWNDLTYTKYTSDYASSSIRKWLNEDFYNTAFTSSQKSSINKTTLDNSAYNVFYSEYDSDTTKDKVFLPSWEEMQEVSYGFASDPNVFDAARMARGTDYAECQGLMVNASGTYKGNSWWRLRTAGNDSRDTCNAGINGNVYYNCKVIINGGIRPAITLNMKALLAKVSGLKASQTTTSVTLKWTKVNGATGYVVYQYNSKTKKYEKVKAVAANQLTIKKLKAGASYKFKVRAYAKVNGKNYYGDYSSVLTTAAKPATPALKVAAGSKQAKLTWNKVTGATGYVIYYSTSKNGSYKKLASTKSTSYAAKKLTKGKTYYFKVRAYKTVGGKNIYGGYSTVKGVKIK